MADASANPKILVVGAGPTGLTAALELSRRGLRPRIIEKGADLSPIEQSRALAINVRTLQLLEAAGATKKILAEAQQVREMRMFSKGRPLARFDTTDVPGRFKGMHTLPQGRTEHILLECLGSHGVAPEWRTELTTLEQTENAEAMTLTGPDGKIETPVFDLVIGADGAHSAVRKAVGLDFAGKVLTETFYLADFRYTEPIDTSHVAANFLNPGVIARIPVDAHTLRYVSTVADFQERIEHPAPIDRVLWVSDFHVSFRHVEPMSKGRVFLAGDAAHIHSPVGGRGMNLGIEDACWLAWLISEGREAEYSALRLPAVRLVLAQTHANTRMVLMRNPVALWLRNVFMPLATTMPWLHRRGIASALGLDTPPPPWLAENGDVKP